MGRDGVGADEQPANSMSRLDITIIANIIATIDRMEINPQTSRTERRNPAYVVG